MPFDCGTCIAKYVLCLFNFIVFLVGSAVLAIGIWVAADKESFISLLKVVNNEELKEFTQPAVIEQASYILIAAGAFMFIVSFLGYCGALRESKCLLSTYGVCLVIILVMEITAGGLVAAYRGKTNEHTQTFLKSTIHKYYAQPPNAVTVLWNQMMVQMSCCGVENYHDFEESKWESTNQTVLPEQCCAFKSPNELVDPNCPKNPTTTNSHFETGCYKILAEWMTQHMDILIGAAIGLALIQVFGIFFAFCLCKSIDDYLK